MKKKLFIRRQNLREKLKRKFSKVESTMPTNLLVSSYSSLSIPPENIRVYRKETLPEMA